MGSADLHLLKRGGVYYWRRRIPRSFAPGFGSSHILLSLRVREAASARRLGRRLSVIFDEAVQAGKGRLTAQARNEYGTLSSAGVSF